MGVDEVFNDAINYRLVAQLLINAGYRRVPAMDTIFTLVARAGDMQLLRWVHKHYRNSLNIFSKMTAIYMQRN